MYINANTIITISAVLAALGGIGGVVVWCIKFVDRQKKQDKELAAIRKGAERLSATACWPA